MPSYTHTTLLQFRNKVYQKLGKSSVPFWNDVELDSLLQQSLLTFGAISGFWKEEVRVDVRDNFMVYDLFPFSGNIAVSSDHSVIYPNMSSQVLFDWINSDLIETLDIFGTADSEFLSADGIIRSMESKYNLFQQQTALVINSAELNVPAQQGIVTLPDNVIDLVRVSFKNDDGTWAILDQADEEEIYQFDQSSLNQSGIPKWYSYVYGHTKDLQLYPVPANTSKLAIMFVSAGLSAGFPAYPVNTIHLPNNLVPYLKFGVLADVFSNDGVWNDPLRAAYCKQRWEEGIIIAKQYNSVYTAKVNGRQISVDSINNLDIYFSDVTQTPGIVPPTIVGFAGFNMFAINVDPKGTEFSIMFLANANAPIPVNNGDFVQVDMEYVDMLADYVVHLAQMKTGAAELAATSHFKDEFLKTAVNHNRRLAQRGITFQSLSDNSKFQDRDSTRTLENVQAQAASTQAQQGY